MTKQPVSYNDYHEACKRIDELENQLASVVVAMQESNKKWAKLYDELLDKNVKLLKELGREPGDY